MNALNVLNSDLNTNNNNNNNNMFRATKVWNQILHSFYIGISLRKHRKNMRSYYNCFIASEAVDWLTNYLQMSPHFTGQQISRFQALNLLRKYLKANVIEKVNARKANYDFQDNKDLYRFTKHANENLPFISTSISNSQQIDLTSKLTKSHNKQKQTIIPELSLTEKSEAFKQIFFKRCHSLIPFIDDFVKIDEIIPLILMHNLTRISNNGVVQLTDKSEDLPHWVMSAMKCLANWPKASGSGSCLPKYPGFQNDVFAVVKDYFLNIGIPLIPNQLYSLIIAIYDMFAINANNVNSQHFNTNQKLSPIVSAIEKLKRQAISNNDLITSTPIMEKTVSTTVQLPPNHIFETVFMGDIPVTKIVSIDELTNLFKPNFRQKHYHSFSNRESNPMHKIGSNDNIDCLCPDPQINDQNRYFEALTTMPRMAKNRLKSPITDNIYKKTYESPESIGSNSSRIGYYNFGFAMQSPTEDGQYMLDKSVSSLSSIYITTNSPNQQKDNLSAQLTKSSNNCSQNSKSTTIINKTIGSDSKLIEAFQLSLYLMPASNRRHLHLLLRLLSKIINNKEINLFLNQNISLKEYVLNTMTRSILCSAKENSYDELKSRKIVCILIDNCKDIFKVPENLIQQIESDLLEKAKQKISDQNSEKESKYYCKQITNDEFELQRDVMSEYALADLLRSIMTDNKLTDREKLKWIKQFKLYHPEVYELYFTNQVRVSHDSKDNRPKSSSMNSIRSQNRNLLKRFLSIRL